MQDQSTAHGKKVHHCGPWVLTSLSLLVLAAATVVAILVGWISVRVGGDTDSGSNQVCNDSMVIRYNEMTEFKIRVGSETAGRDVEQINAINDEISGLENYENDPTCQTMRFWIAFNDGDAVTAKSAYEQLKSLHAEAKYANSNIRDNMPLLMYEQAIAVLTPSEIVNEE